MGPKLYRFLCDLCLPKDCESLKYSGIVDILLKHFSPASIKLIIFFNLESNFKIKINQYTVLLSDEKRVHFHLQVII